MYVLRRLEFCTNETPNIAPHHQLGICHNYVTVDNVCMYVYMYVRTYVCMYIGSNIFFRCAHQLPRRFDGRVDVKTPRQVTRVIRHNLHHHTISISIDCIVTAYIHAYMHTPTARPFILAKQQIMFCAKSGMISKTVPSSTTCSSQKMRRKSGDERSADAAVMGPPS